MNRFKTRWVVLAPALLVVLGVASSLVWASLAQGQTPPVRTLGFGVVRSVAFSPDGRYLAAGGAAGAVHLIDTATWTVVRTLEGHVSWVNCVVFSPDGKLLASGSADGTIKIWEVASGSEVCTLKGHARDVDFVAFNSDGRLLASGSLDGTIKLWDVASGREVRTLDGHTWAVRSVVFSPDGGSSPPGLGMQPSSSGK